MNKFDLPTYQEVVNGPLSRTHPDPGDEDDPITMNGYSYADANPMMNRDPDAHWAWAVVNAGFAVYDGYKAYKAGKNKKQIAWAVASNFVGLGHMKKVGKVLGLAKKSRSTPLQKGIPYSSQLGWENGRIAKYTSFGKNGDFRKEVRFTGKPHNNIPRPNVKYNKKNRYNGKVFYKRNQVRKAKNWELPKAYRK